MFFTAGAAVRFDHKHGKLSFCSPSSAKQRGMRLHTLLVGGAYVLCLRRFAAAAVTEA